MRFATRCALSLLAAALAAPAWSVQVGEASIYSLPGRKMASGARMNPGDDIAASRTLPLGTRARVTNLANGRSTVVTILDRGPRVRDRIVDLSPAAAEKIGLTRKQGTTRVEVRALALPPRDNPTVAEK